MQHVRTQEQRFRLTASAIAAYFKHRCDRLFRYNTVEGRHRGKAGIGWGVPARIRSHSRPGIALLMQAGDEFEIGNLEGILSEHGAGQVRTAGIEEAGARRVVRPILLPDFIALCRTGPLPRFIAQVELNLPPEQEARFLERYGLDPGKITLGPARPDLLEVIMSEGDGSLPRLRVWDFKGSQVARHEHFIQVAFYVLLLEHALREAGIDHVRVDDTEGVIRSRKEDETFELAPYRLAVEDFLRNRAPALLGTRAAEAHFHVREQCALCEYADHCRHEADASADLSRVAYMGSESKRRLRQEGLRSHQQLAHLVPENGYAATIERLRAASHDLSVNLPRYVAAAQALEDGEARPLGTTTLLMPRYEDIRVVISAEQDAVTGTCFALGLKTYEGWDEERNRPRSTEQVFVAETFGTEAHLLLDFLHALGEILRRVDAENRAVADEPVDGNADVTATRETVAGAEEALQQFKAAYPRITKTMPDAEALRARRSALEEALKQARSTEKSAVGTAEWEKRKRQKRLHLYVYDSIDLLALTGLIERHLFDTEPPGLLEELKTLIRLFPPSSVLPDAETFRSVPGTIVTDVLRATVALPVAYGYDLASVSERCRPVRADGSEGGYVFRPKYGFGWPYSNQVAFERIHDVWNGQPFQDTKGRGRDLPPEAVLQEIRETVRAKLRATDSVIQRIKTELGDRLLLRKEPFRLYDRFDPLDFQTLEALRVFTMLEASLEELQVKHLHTLPAEDRAAKFESIRGLRYLDGQDEADGSLWFAFDPASRDAKFDVGEFNLVATPEDEPGVLVGEVDGPLYERVGWRFSHLKVSLMGYDLQADPPRLRLRPDNPAKFREKVDLTRPLVLDRLYIDYNSGKVLDVLARLHERPEQAQHIHDLLAAGTISGWTPLVEAVHMVEQELRGRMAAAGRDPGRLLNNSQWRAWRGVFAEPLTLIWGPPGTGKTHTVAHILIGYALAARAAGHPLRILVTAFTHHAINNVLEKTAEWAEQYGLDPDGLSVCKVLGSGSADDLPDRVAPLSDGDLTAHLHSEPPCVIIGSTVWGVHKAMKDPGGAPRPWFDVVLVDEASQMRLPDALIALSATKPEANIILAGDDQQLPPIIHGTYPEEHAPMLSSVFAFMRSRMEQRASVEPDVKQKMLFQLEENFRMNEPLTAYPRDVLYEGHYTATRPHIKIATTREVDPESSDPLEVMLHPERPAVLCWYEPPRSFTARNPIEADLVARLAARLGEILVHPDPAGGGMCYTPQDLAREGIAVLSPHRAQNSTIRQALMERGWGTSERPLPLVDTVEKLQGKERDVVLVSYGVADEEYADAEADFLLSRNRFNVAATRARHKLVVLCSSAVLDVVPTDRRVLLEAMMLKEFRRYCCDGHVRLPWTTPDLGTVTLNIQWRGFAA